MWRVTFQLWNVMCCQLNLKVLNRAFSIHAYNMLNWKYFQWKHWISFYLIAIQATNITVVCFSRFCLEIPEIICSRQIRMNKYSVANVIKCIILFIHTILQVQWTATNSVNRQNTYCQSHGKFGWNEIPHDIHKSLGCVSIDHEKMFKISTEMICPFGICIVCCMLYELAVVVHHNKKWQHYSIKCESIFFFFFTRFKTGWRKNICCTTVISL